ncbi:MAG TPA: glycosyltransferase family 4 protein [Thermoplasmata archaeon]|nr:glycosyltransferase family 4 protein [Thermoplasmata archaeon]
MSDSPAAEAPLTVFVPLPPSYRGGTEEYAYRVAGRLADRFPVRVATTTARWTDSPANLPLGRATLELLEAHERFERPVVPARARERLRALVRSSSVVHLHMPFPRVERWVAEEARSSGIPLLLTYHMDADLGAATGNPAASVITALYRRLSARPALERSQAVVSNSRGYAEASPVLRHFLPKVRVIAKGIDPSRLGGARAEVRPGLPEAPSPYWTPVPPGEKRLLFVGRLVRYKGLRLLLDAVARLAARRVPLHLLVAGRGPERERLRRRSERLDLRSSVTFLGFVPDAELGALYRGADLAVCPSVSRLESTPTSLEEAASFGVPTLGSDWPGASESLPNDGVRGLLVPPKDVAAIETGIVRLLRDGRRSSAPRIRTWADVADDYAGLIRELTISGTRPPTNDPSGPTSRASAGPGGKGNGEGIG